MTTEFSNRRAFFYSCILSALLLITNAATAQQYDVGIDFRATQSFVTDPAYAVFDNCGNDGTSPQTQTNSNGYSVTWQWSQNCYAASDTNNSVDPRLAGGANVYTASGGETLTITVPQPGTYTIGFATGSMALNQCLTRLCPPFVFRDGASGTTLFTINPTNPGTGHFIDAANRNWTAAQWPANNQQQTVTLTGTTLTVSIGASNAPNIAHIRITSAQPNFSISASPAALSIQQGNQGTSTITTTLSGGFNGAISLSASGAPADTTVSFDPSTIPAPGAGNSTMTITVGSTTPTGTYPITVTGSSGGTQQNATVALTVTAQGQPNFTVSSSPASLSIQQGNQGTSTITTAISGGFNSAIALSASGMPSGTTVSFNPSTIPAPGAGTSTMTITVGSGTPVGTYPITVTGNGGGTQQTTTVTLTVTAVPNFTISASPASLSVQQGNQGTSTITTTISNGFNSAISLSASGVPSGTTVSFNPSTIPAPGSGSSTMTITVGSSTPTGTYPITVTGNGGGTQQTTTVTLTVTAAPNFTILASPASLSVQQGNQGTSTITTTVSNGFNSAIALSASGMPSGTTVSFNPSTIPAPGNGTSTMTITVGSSTPTGTYPITVSGNGGGTQQTTTVTLTVTAAPNFTISASPASLSVQQGNQGTSTITTTVSGGFNSAISLSASGAPSGTTVSFNPSTIPAPGSGSSTMTITVGSSTPTGTYPITVTGNGGGTQQNAAVTLTVTTQQQNYDVGIDFRNTQNYVSDPAYAVFDNCGNDGTNQQTRTNANGISVTWQWSQKCNLAVNESNGVDPRLAGIANVYTASGGETLTLTVPQPGVYYIGFATGNALVNQCGGGHCPNFIFRDGTSGTQLFTVSPNNPGAGHFIDAANKNWTEAQWPASNQQQQVTLTGTTLTVSMAASNAPNIAHIRITSVQQQPNFTISASPASLSIQQGNQGTSTITTTVSGGFNSAISLSASGAPSGTTVSFNPSTIPAPGTGNSTMTITVGSSTPTGTYPITVTGNGGGIQQTTTVTLTVTSQGGQPNFSISASPASLSVGQGNQGTSTITIAISGGFNSAISLSSSGAPSGTTVVFNPITIAAPGAGTSTMTITVGNSTPTGTYPIIVSGNGGGIQQNTTVTLTVTVSGGQSPSDAHFREAYSYTLKATFGKSPYTYQLTSGSLPAGLTLNQSGLISGTPTAVGSSSFQVLVTDSSSPPQQQTFNYTLNVVIGLDTYGGLTAVPSKNGATGFFRMEKQNGRWVFVSPLGNDFYLRSVFHATEAFIESGIMQQRYNNDGELWAAHAHQRMLAYGFNTLGEYTSQRGLPVGTWGSKTNANPVKLPFILFFNATSDILNHPSDVGLTEPFKDIVVGIPQSTYNCTTNYCGQLMDVFDPKWQTGYQGELAIQNKAITGGFASVPWIVAITTEDADYFWAIKGVGTDPVTPYPNPGWLIAVTNFQQSGYQDTKVYSKYAWTNYLQTKYGNIGALNSAWNTGGFYTSFGDAGGYGTGTGVLDEDGRHKWVGTDSYNLTGETSAMQGDINGFLYQYVYQLESVAVNTIKTYDPNHLVVSPSALGGLGDYGIRPPVLQAMVDAGVDILQIGYDPLTPQNVSTSTAAYSTTGKPVFLWYGLSANADSYWHGHKVQYHTADYPTQVKRAQQYDSDQGVIFNAQSANGDYPILGTDLWSVTDSGSGETTDWGLMSDKDNVYDGKCAIIAQSTDQWGYPCGGETANYGDFVDGVTQTNSTLTQQLIIQQQK